MSTESARPEAGEITERSAPAASWRIGPRQWLPLDAPRIIGILNVTPDSFSDGGRFASADEAAACGLRLLEEGACMVDVGGESTRPGAGRVPAQVQIGRVVPVVERLRAATDAPISVDTTRAEVARAALAAGADVVNDVSAGTEDDSMLALAAQRGCGLVLMHRLRPPGEESYSDRYVEPPVYGDLVAEVRRFLLERAEAALEAGVARGALAIDPGLGFGKTVEQSWRLVAGTAELVATGYPVLGAASRKSFLGAATGVGEPRRRVAGSIAVSVAQWLAGVRLFRVHDVAAHREALLVAAAIAPRSGAADGRSV